MRPQDAFALVLKQARVELCLTQADLALRSGLTSRHIRSLEAANACPSLDAVFKLAVALNMKVHELVLRVEEQVAVPMAQPPTSTT